MTSCENTKIKELHTYFLILINFNNIEKYGNTSLFDLKYFTITITNIKKIIQEFFKIKNYQYEKSKIKRITF